MINYEELIPQNGHVIAEFACGHEGDILKFKQLVDTAVEAGATAALLIVAILGDRTKSYVAAGSALGLDLLVEVHDRKELQIAIESGAEIIGVNNRDLSNLQINLETAPMLLTEARNLGYTGLLVAESGYRTRIDLEPISDLADAVLIGSSLAASKDPKVAVATLVDH